MSVWKELRILRPECFEAETVDDLARQGVTCSIHPSRRHRGITRVSSDEFFRGHPGIFDLTPDEVTRQVEILKRAIRTSTCPFCGDYVARVILREGLAFCQPSCYRRYKRDWAEDAGKSITMQAHRLQEQAEEMLMARQLQTWFQDVMLIQPTGDGRYYDPRVGEDRRIEDIEKEMLGSLILHTRCGV